MSSTDPASIDDTARTSAQRADAVGVCERKLAEADLGRYFGVLFLPRAQRTALAPLYAFWEEVREIRDECSDADVARVKLAWWHEELHETFGGNPRHPVTVALFPALRARRLSSQPFFEIIEALGRPIVQPEFTGYADLLDYARRGRGALEELAAQIGADAPVAGVVRELGARLEIAALLRRAGADAQRGRCYLPQEDCTRFGIGVSDLSGATTKAQALLRFEADRLERDVRENLTESAERQTALAIAAQLALATLKRIRVNPEQALRTGVSLTPLRQLWIAWRTARRSRRI